MIYHNVLQAHGIKTAMKVDFGSIDDLRFLTEFLHGGASGVTTPNILDAINNYELKWGYKVWPRSDITDGVGDMPVFAGATSQSGVPAGSEPTSQTFPFYPFGYYAQWWPLALATGAQPYSPSTYLPGNSSDPNANQNNIVYWLQKTTTGALVLTPASAFSDNRGPCVNIDGPQLYDSLVQAANLIRAAMPHGFADFVALSDVPLADHPLNQGGANIAQPVGSLNTDYAQSSGHARNSYWRFVRSTYYPAQVTTAGNHVKDGTKCQIFYMTTQTAGFTGVATGPSAQFIIEATDIDTYHKFGNVNAGVSDGYSAYLAASQAILEMNVRNYIDPSGTQTWLRTSIPEVFWVNVPGFRDIPKEVVLNLPDAAALFQWTGGFAGTPYYNESNPGDDGSIAIGTSIGGTFNDQSASQSQVQRFYLEIYPNWLHHPIMDADAIGTLQPQYGYTTQPASIARAAAVPEIPKFGGIMRKLELPAGFIGYEADSIRLLTIAHDFNEHAQYFPLGLVCHQWGWDSFLPLSQLHLYNPNTKSAMKLSDFNVIYGLPTGGQDPNFANDIAAIKTAVKGGVNLIVELDMQGGWGPALNDLFGESWASGSGATGVQVQNPTHPIWAPYAAADIQKVFGNNFRGATVTKRTRTDPANITPLLTDPVTGDAAWIHKYGLGSVVCWPIMRYGDATQGDCLASGSMYLLMNTIIFLGGQTPPGPYLPQYVDRTSWAAPLNSNGEGVFSGVTVVMVGREGANNEKMIMVSNLNAVTKPVHIKFSTAFYGFLPSWQLVDRNGTTILSGSGDVDANVTAPAQDWMTLYTTQSGIVQATTLSVSARVH